MSSKSKILLVDDEEDLTEFLQFNLESDDFIVSAINDPLSIMGAVKEFKPDLIILDVMMPGLNGVQVCRMLRADRDNKYVPIIFLTAKDQIEDRVKGLESGADDYIAKPFDVRELKLRMKSLLTRASSREEPQKAVSDSIKIGNVEIFPTEYKVLVDNNEVQLTITEFNLLNLLMSRRGRVQTREHILVNVWNYESDLETRTIDTHIRRLRKKLGDPEDFIDTVRGVGYRIK